MKRTNFISYATAICFSVFIFLNLILICTTAYAKRSSKLSEYSYIYLLLGLALFAIISAVIFFKRKRITRILSKIDIGAIILLSVILFATQAILYYNIYFQTGWDPEYIFRNIIAYANGDKLPGGYIGYFSRYSNNVFLVVAYAKLFSVLISLGITSPFALLYCGILIQSVLSSVTGYLIFRILQKELNNVFAFFGWTLFVFLVGLSPWNIVLYSDATTLIIPTVLLRLYQLTQNDKYVYLKWCAIGILTVLGLKLKPQSMIITIAIIMVDFVLSMERGKILLLFKRLGTFAVSAVVIFSLISGLLKLSPYKYDSSHAFSPAHYFMMGLNEKTVGGYSEDDVKYSQGFTDYEKRAKSNLIVAKDRLNDFGVFGLAKHLAKKAVKTYSDGTFGWSGEGTFYKTVLPKKNDTLSPFLRSIFYKDGKYYGVYKSIMQAVWLAMLFSSLGIIPYFVFKKPSRTLTVLILSLIGLTMFQLLFETRARYLYIYSPFFVMLSIFGWLGLYYIARHISKYFRRFSKNLP